MSHVRRGRRISKPRSDQTAAKPPAGGESAQADAMAHLETVVENASVAVERAKGGQDSDKLRQAFDAVDDAEAAARTAAPRVADSTKRKK